MKNKRAVAAMAGLLVVAVLGSTYAYWSQTATVDNEFNTGKMGSTITEDFVPEDGEDWKPGAEVNKDVVVDNTGESDVIVRVKLDEKWVVSGEETPFKTNTAATGDVYTVSQGSATDGLTEADKSVVEKNFAASTNWVDGGDGWYYYKSNVAGGTSTDKWLDSVTLASDADMGLLEIKTYVTTDETISDASVWYEYTGVMPKYVDATGAACEKDAPGAAAVYHNRTTSAYTEDASGNELTGYSGSTYTLTVTAQVVQPTQDALDAVFGAGSAFTAPAGTSWTVE